MEDIIMLAFIACAIITLIHKMLAIEEGNPFLTIRLFLDAVVYGNIGQLLLWECQYCMTWVWGTVIYFINESLRHNLFTISDYVIYIFVLGGLNIIADAIQRSADK